jgi:8-oxo-dGTP diphosphatase
VVTHRAATMIVRRPDGTILMQLRDDGRGRPIPYPNMWNFPGGIVERGESPLQAGIREIAEEFEIQLDQRECSELFVYAHDDAESNHVFLCTIRADIEPILHEGAAFAWMTLNEIGSLELGFDQAQILPHIRLGSA